MGKISLFQLESYLETFLKSQARELSKLKGFNLKNCYKFFSLILSGIGPTVELWKDATPEQRKEACVNVANRHFDIPFIPEFIEGYLIAIVYDLVISRVGK